MCVLSINCHKRETRVEPYASASTSWRSTGYSRTTTTSTSTTTITTELNSAAASRTCTAACALVSIKICQIQCNSQCCLLGFCARLKANRDWDTCNISFHLHVLNYIYIKWLYIWSTLLYLPCWGCHWQLLMQQVSECIRFTWNIWMA